MLFRSIVPDVRSRQDTPETVFPGGINPLTGETADDPELLRKVPALVPISRYPDEARPRTSRILSGRATAEVRASGWT